ncbi:MAG: DoxX family protein [Pseudomonadota bacterium]
MSGAVQKYGLLLIKALLTLAFGAAGAAKLAGAEMMVGTFDAIGWGQWFRYATGGIEVAAAVLLWVPGLQALAAGALVATMIGAIIAHIAVLGPSFVPALALGVLATVVLYAHRVQILK